MTAARPLNCRVCGKDDLGRMEIGLNKKLLDNAAGRFFCLKCLSEYLEVDEESLVSKAEELKEMGCDLF